MLLLWFVFDQRSSADTRLLAVFPLYETLVNYVMFATVPEFDYIAIGPPTNFPGEKRAHVALIGRLFQTLSAATAKSLSSAVESRH